MTAPAVEHWAPDADPAAVAAVAERVEAAGVPVERGRALGPFTTFGIGGPGAVYAEPAGPPELAAVLRALAGTDAAEVPLLVLGRGSNTLVSDEGFPGLVLRLGPGFTHIEHSGRRVSADGAVAMPALAAWTAAHGLAGLEFGAGIPGSVGGSVRMNAGAHGGDMARHLAGVDVCTAGDGALHRLGLADLDLGYRRSTLPPRSVVVGAHWDLVPDDPAAIRSRLDGIRAWRRAAQPLRERSCGSVFTNPPGDSAGRLIDAAGLKGCRRGGARVSEKHANFIVVEPGTRAEDVLGLILEVRQAVAAAGGPQLHPEVRVVGRFPALTAVGAA